MSDWFSGFFNYSLWPEQKKKVSWIHKTKKCVIHLFVWFFVRDFRTVHNWDSQRRRRNHRTSAGRRPLLSIRRPPKRKKAERKKCNRRRNPKHNSPLGDRPRLNDEIRKNFVDNPKNGDKAKRDSGNNSGVGGRQLQKRCLNAGRVKSCQKCNYFSRKKRSKTKIDAFKLFALGPRPFQFINFNQKIQKKEAKPTCKRVRQTQHDYRPHFLIFVRE